MKAVSMWLSVALMKQLIGGRCNSLWPLTFATSCCGIEFMSVGAARYDMARFGFEVARCKSSSGRFYYGCWNYCSQDGSCIETIV